MSQQSGGEGMGRGGLLSLARISFFFFLLAAAAPPLRTHPVLTEINTVGKCAVYLALEDYARESP